MKSGKTMLGISLAAVCIALTLASVQARADDGQDRGDWGQYARRGDGDGPAWSRPEGEDRPEWHPEREDDQPRWRREQEENDDNSEGSFGLTIGPIFSPPVRVYSPPPPPATSYWYYCAPAQAYYPNVQSCPVGWQLVPAR